MTVEAARRPGAWTRFWFEPQPTSTLAVVRIAFGLLAVAWTVTMATDVEAFFAPHGIVPSQPEEAWLWGVLGPSRPLWAVWALWAVLLVGSICLTLGLGTRLAAIVVFVGVLSLERRNPFVFNAGDVLVRTTALSLALAPAGAALSLDRWLRARHRFWEFPARAPWALRLVQIQLTILYATTVWSKLLGATWPAGTAVSYALRIEDHVRFGAPGFVTDSETVSVLLTWGTLGLECALAVLVWVPRARPWVLAAGVTMHLGIELTLLVGFFTAAIFVSYLAFVPPETMRARILAVRDRLAGSAPAGAS